MLAAGLSREHCEAGLDAAGLPPALVAWAASLGLPLPLVLEVVRTFMAGGAEDVLDAPRRRRAPTTLARSSPPPTSQLLPSTATSSWASSHPSHSHEEQRVRDAAPYRCESCRTTGAQPAAVGERRETVTARN
jgi:hypothetical protein